MALEPEKDDAVAFDAQSFAQAWLEPTYLADNQQTAPIWAESQLLRELLERGRRGVAPSPGELRDLRNAVLRQLPSLGLYRELSVLRQGPMGAAGKDDNKKVGIGGAIGLYVLVFPGEAKDNTGIKDLNDNVLGYELNSEWIAMRQKAVTEVFWQPDSTPAPKWVTVGQDYKTAYVLPLGKTAKDFAADLVDFDRKLKAYLLPILDKAEADARKKNDDKRQKAIGDLRKRLNKKDVYRFPYLYGYAEQPLMAGTTIALTLRLITEALKAAAVARWDEKRDDLGERPVKLVAKSVSIGKTPRGEDDRGRAFDVGTFLDVFRTADRIKDTVRKQSDANLNVNYNITYVNTVWISVFVIYRRKPYANPDVVRDIRKKQVTEPPLGKGVKVAFKATVEFVELWLVTLNMIDFVAGFLAKEFPDQLATYHALARSIFSTLVEPDPPSTKPPAIDWDRLIRFLTYDMSQKIKRSVLGATSEFTFYAYASDWMDQIFVALDIRDLGVELMTHYEIANEIIVDDKLRDTKLMQATFMAGDLTVERKRVTYDAVVAVFRDYYKKLLSASGAGAAQDLFSPAPLETTRLPDFDQSIQVMLGGDEVFVAAHPFYAQHIPAIISDINAQTSRGNPLNLRAGVGLSSAERTPGRRVPQNPTDEQRKANQKAHDGAIRAASATHKVLKSLERLHRRIELLIYKLENNDKKAHLAPDHRTALDDLGLMRLYAQARNNVGADKKGTFAANLLKMLNAVDVAGLTRSSDFDLIDYTGKKVVLESLVKKAEALAAQVAKDVGMDNYYFEVPYITQMPKWFKKVIDRYVKDQWPFGDAPEDDEKKKP